MSRNLVVCLDGTDNEFCLQNTNVVRMFQSLIRDPERQIPLYDAGVGTIWEPGTLSKASQKIQLWLGMAFGLGVTRNVAEAYAFLMNHHREGDRIFLFGFSRGALEVRALAALIHRCGLLEPQLGPLEPYAMRLFQTAGNNEVVSSFKETFSRDIGIEFLGIWDTVTSMGNVWSPVRWPHTTWNPSVKRVAHAIAIDERRAFFRQNRWSPADEQRVDEEWFAGVHSDVGGGYDPHKGRLWAITLEWMAAHAREAELLFDDSKLQAALNLGRAEAGSCPDAATDQNDSMSPFWKALELVPRRSRARRDDGTFDEERWMLPFRHSGFRGRPRRLSPGEKVHRSAIERFVARSDYRPETLTNAGLNLEVASTFLNTDQRAWVVPSRT